MGTELDLPALHFVHQYPQLPLVADHTGFDGGFAGHGVEQGVPGAFGIGAAGAQQFRGDLLQGGGDPGGVQLRRTGAAEDGVVAKVLGLEAEAVQQGQMLQQGGVFVRRQGDGFAPEQGLAHDGGGVGLQAVKVDALMGGVLVDQVDIAVAVLSDDIGAQHLARDAPGRFCFRLQPLLAGHFAAFGGPFREKGLLPGFRGGGRRLFPARRLRGRSGGQGFCRCGCGHSRFRGSGDGRAFGGGGLNHVGHPGAAAQLCAGKKAPAGRSLLFGEAGQGFSGGGGALGPEFFGAHGAVKVRLFFGRSGLGRGRGPGGGLFPAALQGGEHRVVHRIEGGAFVQKFYHGFGRVDVHIHRIQGQGQVQHAAGELALHHLVAVSLFQGCRQQGGFHIAAVDKEMLHGAAAPAL